MQPQQHENDNENSDACDAQGTAEADVDTLSQSVIKNDLSTVPLVAQYEAAGSLVGNLCGTAALKLAELLSHRQLECLVKVFSVLFKHTVGKDQRGTIMRGASACILRTSRCK